MIEYYTETDFVLTNEKEVSNWISETIMKEDYNEGAISYIFCDDDYLLRLNRKYLKHNTLTDIISFDYSTGSMISGDIFISVERVQENADDFKKSFTEELHRVIIHGILHFCGYTDKKDSDKTLMRSKEDYYLSLQAF